MIKPRRPTHWKHTLLLFDTALPVRKGEVVRLASFQMWRNVENRRHYRIRASVDVQGDAVSGPASGDRTQSKVWFLWM
jgi:hypothetical protein